MANTTTLILSLLILSGVHSAICDCPATPPPPATPRPPSSATTTTPGPPVAPVDPISPPPSKPIPPNPPTPPPPPSAPPPAPCPPPHPTPSTPPTPPPSPSPSKQPKAPSPGGPSKILCPKHMIKFGLCADIPGLIHTVVGNPPSGSRCCAMLGGLARMEMAMCLCTAIKANILGINLNIPVACSVILSACQADVPTGFKCEAD